MQYETVTGYIEHIIYQNAENGYTVFELGTSDALITVTGNLGQVAEGERIICHGQFVVHHIYGEQFQAQFFEIKEPEDLVSIERYLGSGAIKGVGPALAKRIIKAFGEDTLRVLDEEPERLSEIRGISGSGARLIAEQVSEKRELRRATMFLQDQGISLGLAVKIYEHYGQEIYDVIEKNPYRLAEDISGIGFRTADEIAKNSKFSIDENFRIRSGIYFALISATSDGHVYLPKDILYNTASELVGYQIENFDDQLIELIIEKKIIKKEIDVALQGSEEIIYPAVYYYMEKTISEKLLRLSDECEADVKTIDKVLDFMSSELNIEHDEAQKRAILGALSHTVSVITGGPGTGKTTIINALINVFEEEGLDVFLAAPTGRAAKRMTETTKREAKTVHRLLEFQGRSDEEESIHFYRGEENPLECDVVIIDEASMIDVFLMNALVKAVPKGAKLILVGDANQLPSVGPGNVLRDIIESGVIHTELLSKIYRQEAASDIVINAHKIQAGDEIDSTARSKDFLFVKRNDSGRILGSIVTLVKEKLPDYVHADSFDIQVLSPMRKGPLGVVNLNRILQEALNPPSKSKREHTFAYSTLREGDKVMQIKNNYDRHYVIRNKKGLSVGEGEGVFNGDLGKIKEINLFSEEITVCFDDKEVIYSYNNVGELELAYAVTVHKSQGSEYPAVVIPLLNGPRPLMNRNLLYTGITRAKSCVCIVGSTDCFDEMVRNNEEQKRYSGLADQLRKGAKWKEENFQ